MSMETLDSSDRNDRFGGLGRLIGQRALETLRTSHVMIIGLGGVGSWSAESLARSGLGRLTLIDRDELCITNINRQIHALDSSIAQPKIEVLKTRLHQINPQLQIDTHLTYYTPTTSDTLLSDRPDFLIDAIDHLDNKCHLINTCKKSGIPLITCGGAGGKIDPTLIRQTDLSKAHHDRLLKQVRKKLRAIPGFPPYPGRNLHVPCVFSEERATYPGSDGEVCSTNEQKEDLRLNCEGGFGSACHVTAIFGLQAAAFALKTLAGKE